MVKNSIAQILNEVEVKGYKFNKKYHGCAQSALGPLMDFFNLDKPEVFKSASGLGGGVGQSFEGTCGALAAGVMVVSLFYGRELNNIEDPEGMKVTCYDLSKKLHMRFVKEYGSSICKDIHKKIFRRTYDLKKPGEWDAFLADGGHSHKCPEVVGKAVKWTVELILNEKEMKTEKKNNSLP